MNKNSKLIKRVQQILLLASFIFLGYFLVKNWAAIMVLLKNIDASLFLLSVLLLIGVFFLDAIGWALIVSAINGKQKLKPLVRIWLFSSIIRYIPGVIWTYANRIIASKQVGVSVSVSSASLVLENIFLAITAFIIGIPSILAVLHLDNFAIAVIYICSIVAIACLPLLLEQAKKIPGKIGSIFSKLVYPSGFKIIGLLLYYLIFWSLFSGVFLLFVSSVTELDGRWLLVVASMFAMSFAFGFILIIFPGGLGVREIILYGALSTIYTSDVSLALSIGSRLWLVFGEAISVLIAFTIKDDS